MVLVARRDEAAVAGAGHDIDVNVRTLQDPQRNLHVVITGVKTLLFNLQLDR